MFRQTMIASSGNELKQKRTYLKHLKRKKHNVSKVEIIIRKSRLHIGLSIY